MVDRFAIMCSLESSLVVVRYYGNPYPINESSIKRWLAGLDCLSAVYTYIPHTMLIQQFKRNARDN